MRKSLAKSQLRHILQNTWPALFKTAKDIENKERLRNWDIGFFGFSTSALIIGILLLKYNIKIKLGKNSQLKNYYKSKTNLWVRHKHNDKNERAIKIQQIRVMLLCIVLNCLFLVETKLLITK